jgi:hypothetical protein
MSAVTVNIAQNNSVSYTNKNECLKLLKVLNQRYLLVVYFLKCLFYKFIFKFNI